MSNLLCSIYYILSLEPVLHSPGPPPGFYYAELLLAFAKKEGAKTNRS